VPYWVGGLGDTSRYGTEGNQGLVGGFGSLSDAFVQFHCPIWVGYIYLSMKHTQKYTDEPLGRLEVIDDFLPPPDQLVLKEDGVKVTISLSKKSVDFFKAHAARSKVPYQRMIRSLLDTYAVRHSDQPLTKRSTGRATKSTRRSA